MRKRIDIRSLLTKRVHLSTTTSMLIKVKHCQHLVSLKEQHLQGIQTHQASTKLLKNI